MKVISKIIILSVIVITLACNVFTPTPTDNSVINCVETPSGLVSWWRGEGNATDSAGHYDGMFVT
jgi:hypothetical protein